VEGHRYYGVKAFIHRNGLRKKARQMPSQRFHAGVLVKVNQVAKRALVKPEAGRAVESAKAGTADRAQTLLIQREPVQKRGIAGGAKIFRFKWFGGVEALVADRNAGPSNQRTLADTTFIREKQREDSVG
jgi:hypothetical protein